MVGVGEDLDPNHCGDYYKGVPTFSFLSKHPPPEYWPLLAISAVLIVINGVVTVIAISKQRRFLEGASLVPALRSITILLAFTIFAATSFSGMFSMRSSQYLHSIGETYEVCCILIFYENICGHLRLHDFYDETDKIILTTGPCCCCLRCLKPVSASQKTVGRLRLGMKVSIILQILLQFVRTIRTFECEYQPNSTSGMVMNVTTITAFLFAMWGLVVMFRSGYKILAQYKYVGKFLAFKGMIFTSKFLYTVLSIIASYSKGSIPDYETEVDGKTVLILKDKSRLSIWTNFISVVFTTTLLALTYKLYDSKDYELYLEHDNSTVKYQTKFSENPNYKGENGACREEDI
ncbi:hypothetical protein ACHWQZ_G013853 [Mnemiopsis leidyi]